MSDSHFREEPRFYPNCFLNVTLEEWRQLPFGERIRQLSEFNKQLLRHRFERIRIVHGNWNDNQQKLMLFKLYYAREHFDVYSQAQIQRGKMTPEEVEVVAETPIPTNPKDKAKYL